MSVGTAIGQGPGNLVPDAEHKQFLATVAVSKGECVMYSGTDGYSVALLTATTKFCGVATDDIAAGEWGEFIVKGFCGYMITDGAVADRQILIGDAVAGAGTGAAIGTASNYMFGVALAADVSTLLSAAIIF